MTPTERKEQARQALERRINQEVFSGRFGRPDVPPKLTVDDAIDAYADACVAEALAAMAERLRRCQKQAAHNVHMDNRQHFEARAWGEAAKLVDQYAIKGMEIVKP